MRFLFVDRILALTPGGVTQGIKHVTSDDYYLCLDEQSRRYFVPSLVGETVGQLAAWNVMLSNDFTKRPVAGIAEIAKNYSIFLFHFLILSIKSGFARIFFL